MMKHRRELTCTACGETIESEVFHCMSGDILCTDCMASQYASEHQLDRKAALAQVKDDPCITVYHDAGDYLADDII